MSNKPVIVFVPGAWHKAKCYNKVIDILQSKHDFTCFAVTLPSTLGDRNATFEDDIQATRTIVSQQVNQSRDVVIIAHSYGGMVGNSVIKGFPKSRECGDGTGKRRLGRISLQNFFDF
jgi:surfactin synthase thioesterase subunit